MAEQLGRGVRVESVEQRRVPTSAERPRVVAEPVGEVGVGGVDHPQLRDQRVVGLPEQLPHDQGARGGQLLGAQCDVVDGGVDSDEGERCRRIERRRREWTPHADQCMTQRIEAGQPPIEQPRTRRCDGGSDDGVGAIGSAAAGDAAQPVEVVGRLPDRNAQRQHTVGIEAEHRHR